jgi:hypothetical protein
MLSSHYGFFRTCWELLCYYFQLIFQTISNNACSPNYYWYNKAFPLPRSLNLCTQSFIFEFFSSLFLHYILIRSCCSSYQRAGFISFCFKWYVWFICHVYVSLYPLVPQYYYTYLMAHWTMQACTDIIMWYYMFAFCQYITSRC